MHVTGSGPDPIYGTAHSPLTAEARARSPRQSMWGSVIGKEAMGWAFFLALRHSPANIPAPAQHNRTNSQGCEVTQTRHAMYV